VSTKWSPKCANTCSLKVHAGRDKNVLETLLATCTNEKYKLAMEIALRTFGLRGNINYDDLLLELPRVPTNSSNTYRNCLDIQTLTSATK
jgi:hypothetical protein